MRNICLTYPHILALVYSQTSRQVSNIVFPIAFRELVRNTLSVKTLNDGTLEQFSLSAKE